MLQNFSARAFGTREHLFLFILEVRAKSMSSGLFDAGAFSTDYRTVAFRAFGAPEHLFIIALEDRINREFMSTWLWSIRKILLVLCTFRYP